MYKRLPNTDWFLISKVKASKDCGDDEDCELGSGSEDRIPIKELLPALEKV